jgi:mono/diheme cytochrome c family protein
MTRQSRARWLAFATALLVVLLAALFAWLRNLTPPPQVLTVPAAATTADSRNEVGRAAFVRAGCSGCHSAEGRGPPGLPLDGVGARLDREALRAAAFAQGDAALDRFPPGVAERKRGHANDAEAEALLAYLQQLK